MKKNPKETLKEKSQEILKEISKSIRELIVKDVLPIFNICLNGSEKDIRSVLKECQSKTLIKTHGILINIE